MANTFKEGDVVQLKSGGPRMTITSVGDYLGTLTAWCSWFVQDKAPWKKDNGTYPVAALKLIGRDE